MIYILLFAFQVKHFLCDYPLQGRYMLGKFREFPYYIEPLLAHSAVHGLGTLAIVLCVNPLLWRLAIVDVVAHFIIDRVKASPRLLGRWRYEKPQFWWALGFDQMLHHLTHYMFIWMLLR